MKYRKKPVVVDAFRFLELDSDTFPEWFYNSMAWRWGEDQESLIIATLEGDMTAALGCYIIKGISGELYPCKAEIFQATYEEEG